MLRAAELETQCHTSTQGTNCCNLSHGIGNKVDYDSDEGGTVEEPQHLQIVLWVLEKEAQSAVVTRGILSLDI